MRCVSKAVRGHESVTSQQDFKGDKHQGGQSFFSSNFLFCLLLGRAGGKKGSKNSGIGIMG